MTDIFVRKVVWTKRHQGCAFSRKTTWGWGRRWAFLSWERGRRTLVLDTQPPALGEIPVFEATSVACGALLRQTKTVGYLKLTLNIRLMCWVWCSQSCARKVLVGPCLSLAQRFWGPGLHCHLRHGWAALRGGITCMCLWAHKLPTLCGRVALGLWQGMGLSQSILLIHAIILTWDFVGSNCSVRSFLSLSPRPVALLQMWCSVLTVMQLRVEFRFGFVNLAGIKRTYFLGLCQCQKCYSFSS